MEDITIFLTFYNFGEVEDLISYLSSLKTKINNKLSKKQTIWMKWAVWPLVNYLNAMILAFVLEGKEEGRMLLPAGRQRSVLNSFTWFHT